MKTRTVGEAIQVLNETALPKSFTDSETCKSLQSATLTLARILASIRTSIFNDACG